MPIRVANQNEARLAAQSAAETPSPPADPNDLERRREIGQFFTPMVVAEFIWDFLEIIHGAKFPKRTRVIDPSCGEGVFLRVAGARGNIAPEVLFGVDIDETLAPVWQGDPLLKKAHLAVTNGLLDLADRGVKAGTFDLVIGNPPFAGKGVRDLLRMLDEANAPVVQPETDLFGALILQESSVPASPPLTAQERIQLDQLAKVLARFACWRLTKDPAENGEVEAAEEGDDMFAGWAVKNSRKNGANSFAQAAEMAAAWPLNRLLNPQNSETRLLLRRLASTAIEVFFMERFLRLAKPGGLIAVIVPESIVASDQLAPLRTWLLTELDLLAVVSLPQKVFAGVGANAKTSVVFSRRLLRQRLEPPHVNDEDMDTEENGGPGPKVFFAAPQIGAPDYRFDRYLNDVLQDAKLGAARFKPGET